MRSAAYVTVMLVLFFILQNVKSRKHARTHVDLKANSKETNPVDKFDVSKFVDHLIKSAKLIMKKKTKTGKPQTKKIQKKNTDDEIDESNYDSLGLDDNVKDQIVRSNTADADLISLNEMERLFRASNDALAYNKKRGRILRSGGGLSLNDGKEQDGKLLRSIDGPSKEDGGELIFDLEDGEDVGALKHLFF